MEGLQGAKIAGEMNMALTRAFKDTVQARMRKDRKYRKALLREGAECLLAGDLDTGKAILRDYINATIGFEELSRRTRRPAKSLMRMLGPKGNPQARNLCDVIGHLQRAEGLHFELSLRAASKAASDHRSWIDPTREV
jgi:DNA-binding phage protein